MQRHATGLALAALLAGCEDPPAAPGAGSTTPRIERPAGDVSPLAGARLPVRIGELGTGFSACAGRGTPRRPDAPVAVRAAPYEAAAQTDAIAPGAELFVCSRSIDQAWLGIVYGGDAAACGVLASLPRRRDYDGPCRSGWVTSAEIRVRAR